MSGKIVFFMLVVIIFCLNLHGKCMESNLQTIYAYEKAGDYVKALGLARSCQEPSEELVRLIESLESAVLHKGYSYTFFDENKKPRTKLIKVLDLLGMKDITKPETTLLEVNNWAQSHLLRQGERWTKQVDRFEELKPKIRPLLQDLGLIEARLPSFISYEGAIVYGSLLPGMCLRFDYLIEAWKKGVRFTHLYFLTGQRPVNLEKETGNVFLQGQTFKIEAETESAMVRVLFERPEVPKDMKDSIQVHFISVPMKKEGGVVIRPTTDDTVIAWLESAPPFGRYLAVTNAPYIERQDLVVRTLTAKKGDFTFDTVGPVAKEDEQIAIFLDELARVIFQNTRRVEAIQ